ncbi:MAG: AEC family transporter, partial [Candidatus Hydrothermarchaeaceae archaeon]
IFGLEGLDRQVVILSSMMPVGVNSMVFSARENLDVEFAASAVSISIIMGLVLVPLAIAVL